MRDGDLSGKELSSNQPGVCPTGGCAHSGKKKKRNQHFQENDSLRKKGWRLEGQGSGEREKR